MDGLDPLLKNTWAPLAKALCRDESSGSGSAGQKPIVSIWK